MRKQTRLDERQLWQRGNVFQHGFLFLIVALGVEALCKAFAITWAEGSWEQILIIWGAVALCWWEFILRDINPMGKSQKAFYFAMGLCGVFILVTSLALVGSGQGSGFLNGARLSQRGAIALTGCMMASVLAVYLVKTFRDRRRPTGDED